MNLHATVDFRTYSQDVVLAVADAEYVFAHLGEFRFLRTTEGRRISVRYVIEARLVPEGGYPV